mmetsp:Transcript_20775/g.70714  ORF Transcript_20775/g.70714 Transcript_20775/m.70714 type:complete len:134 (+) Transcript_20775:62-463(+)|eukprot:CAMPEP_0183795626 /NCGR_PEP_ID=MMETSP0803_2-20130417/4891_1 /TAXON_ID=195967 /ORGANISM="Crustomastix stigmata, Strain CCMP3273" /LENGTH=133 /DNA_ID=CAMNT_0026040075 /DNA_START=43 /DNA_END=444 /DNA_ORIENTATION=-
MADTDTSKGDGKVISVAELGKHNTEKDCWMAIDGKVYDVTEFLDEHPGGGDIMVTSSGRDATEDYDDVGHSQHARSMMEKYLVGDYEGGAPDKSARVAADSGSGPLATLLPIVVVLIAIIVMVLGKKSAAEGA